MIDGVKSGRQIERDRSESLLSSLAERRSLTILRSAVSMQ